MSWRDRPSPSYFLSSAANQVALGEHQGPTHLPRDLCPCCAHHQRLPVVPASDGRIACRSTAPPHKCPLEFYILPDGRITDSKGQWRRDLFLDTDGVMRSTKGDAVEGMLLDAAEVPPARALIRRTFPSYRDARVGKDMNAEVERISKVIKDHNNALLTLDKDRQLEILRDWCRVLLADLAAARLPPAATYLLRDPQSFRAVDNLAKALVEVSTLVLCDYPGHTSTGWERDWLIRLLQPLTQVHPSIESLYHAAVSSPPRKVKMTRRLPSYDRGRVNRWLARQTAEGGARHKIPVQGALEDTQIICPCCVQRLPYCPHHDFEPLCTEYTAPPRRRLYDQCETVTAWHEDDQRHRRELLYLDEAKDVAALPRLESLEYTEPPPPDKPAEEQSPKPCRSVRERDQDLLEALRRLLAGFGGGMPKEYPEAPEAPSTPGTPEGVPEDIFSGMDLNLKVSLIEEYTGPYDPTSKYFCYLQTQHKQKEKTVRLCALNFDESARLKGEHLSSPVEQAIWIKFRPGKTFSVIVQQESEDSRNDLCCTDQIPLDDRRTFGRYAWPLYEKGNSEEPPLALVRLWIDTLELDSTKDFGDSSVAWPLPPEPSARSRPPSPPPQREPPPPQETRSVQGPADLPPPQQGSSRLLSPLPQVSVAVQPSIQQSMQPSGSNMAPGPKMSVAPGASRPMPPQGVPPAKFFAPAPHAVRPRPGIPTHKPRYPGLFKPPPGPRPGPFVRPGGRSLAGGPPSPAAAPPGGISRLESYKQRGLSRAKTAPSPAFKTRPPVEKKPSEQMAHQRTIV